MLGFVFVGLFLSKYQFPCLIKAGSEEFGRVHFISDMEAVGLSARILPPPKRNLSLSLNYMAQINLERYFEFILFILPLT